jgi:hypothetical protein
MQTELARDLAQAKDALFTQTAPAELFASFYRSGGQSVPEEGEQGLGLGGGNMS